MAISLYKIKKWSDMLLGKSIHHVNQDEGKIYSKDQVRGYYNNLTEKVTRGGEYDVPKSFVDTGEKIYFSIEIFQYGLGAYDLYLLSDKKDEALLRKAVACADWAIKDQQEDGAWVTFAYETPDYPYSAMAQGEAISLLLRVYQETKDEKYLDAAKKAKSFMLLSFEEGGPTKYDGSDVYLYECPKDPLILNGWIFSLWGLMDFCKIVDDTKAKDVLDRTLATLEKRLPDFNLSYWSMYEDGKRISSPFYHKLHVAQLNVMYDLTGKEVYKAYADKWHKYELNWFYRKLAFIKKACQKVLE